MKSFLFTQEILRAKLEVLERLGKAQTRRLTGLEEINKDPDRWERLYEGNKGTFTFWHHNPDIKEQVVKPRYQVGDIVYIREAWAVGEQWNKIKPSKINPLASLWYPLNADLMNIPLWVGRLRSPLFMPEWAARHFWRVTDVRAERLQDITPRDCLAEGINLDTELFPEINRVDKCKVRFRMLWDSTKPRYTWDFNPWVFVYTFEKANR